MVPGPEPKIIYLPKDLPDDPHELGQMQKCLIECMINNSEALRELDLWRQRHSPPDYYLEMIAEESMVEARIDRFNPGDPARRQWVAREASMKQRNWGAAFDQRINLENIRTFLTKEQHRLDKHSVRVMQAFCESNGSELYMTGIDPRMGT